LPTCQLTLCARWTEPPSAQPWEDGPGQWQRPPTPADPRPGPRLYPHPKESEPRPDYLRHIPPPGPRRAPDGPPPLGPNPAARGIAPLAPEFTRNLVRQTARILDVMDRVMRPGGITTPEGLSAAFHAGMQYLAAHKGDVAAAIASAKAAAAVRRDSAPEVAVPAKAELAKPAVHHEPTAAPDEPHPQAEQPSEPRPAWHGFVPTSSRPEHTPDSAGHLAKEAWHLMEAVGSFPFRHPRATAEVAGTEIIGLGPEDPAADVAAGAEIAVAEDAAVAAAKRSG
jgi:hypothetical protein